MYSVLFARRMVRIRPGSGVAAKHQGIDWKPKKSGLLDARLGPGVAASDYHIFTVHGPPQLALVSPT